MSQSQPFAITEGVLVSVLNAYAPRASNPREDRYSFAYQITIENQTPFSIQLLRRHWHIVDAYGERREVEGEGVVGEQPILRPQGGYQYVSGTHFTTSIGKMYGRYLMQRVTDQRNFWVKIPEFVMEAPIILN